METSTQNKTIKEILTHGSRFLEEHNVINWRPESERLIAFALKIERAQIYIGMDKQLSEKQISKLRSLFMARAAGKPIQYLIGEASFRYLKLKVDTNVLIPRPETELIVDILAGKINGESKILELGTGSGAIAISIAKELKVNVDATDINHKAIEVAKTNALINDIEGVNWIQSSWFEQVKGYYDFIVSNPPYVSLDEYQTLSKEIKYEPVEAITDNADGLECIRQIIKEAPGFLNKDGHLILEIGHGQKNAVEKLFRSAGFKGTEFEKDLAGIDRFAIAQM